MLSVTVKHWPITGVDAAVKHEPWRALLEVAAPVECTLHVFGPDSVREKQPALGDGDWMTRVHVRTVETVRSLNIKRMSF